MFFSNLAPSICLCDANGHGDDHDQLHFGRPTSQNYTASRQVAAQLCSEISLGDSGERLSRIPGDATWREMQNGKKKTETANSTVLAWIAEADNCSRLPSEFLKREALFDAAFTAPSLALCSSSSAHDSEPEYSQPNFVCQPHFHCYDVDAWKRGSNHARHPCHNAPSRLLFALIATHPN